MPWCALILNWFHGIIEVTEWSLQTDVHIMNATLEQHLYQSWKGIFWQQKIFTILQRCDPFSFGWNLLKQLYFKLNAGKAAGLQEQHFCHDLHFLSFSIFSISDGTPFIYDIWSLDSSLVCIQSPSFLIWWWLGRSFAMEIGQILKRSTVLSMRESCFSFVSRQHILLLYYMIL